ncbi:hypothetical protein SODALDRAFT_58217 [Sodiomyces alkalinus F11]|uniref:Secreted protein n=1 Tax=Sodiomyces alkalinus (strain CBS 110278 / VKM F-3762 / F11) TaxID=1314773 RepID=A0A3N2PNP7_SODAK|nr:hypothetical protein SODALDRAFT_58217 [Sodiomyces alkalinus F11]ROT36119.1 hypothetical protein SODALDRAFT_58217 [Sodiomyces alkalinus F11]
MMRCRLQLPTRAPDWTHWRRLAFFSVCLLLQEHVCPLWASVSMSGEDPNAERRNQTRYGPYGDRMDPQRGEVRASSSKFLNRTGMNMAASDLVVCPPSLCLDLGVLSPYFLEAVPRANTPKPVTSKGATMGTWRLATVQRLEKRRHRPAPLSESPWWCDRLPATSPSRHAPQRCNGQVEHEEKTTSTYPSPRPWRCWRHSYKIATIVPYDARSAQKNRGGSNICQERLNFLSPLSPTATGPNSAKSYL